MIAEEGTKVSTDASVAGPVRLESLTVQSTRPAVPEWGSDVAAEMMRRLGMEYVALNPGASYRGIHDSLVNYNGNTDPGIILCNHEETAVAIAHGWAKWTGRAMGAFVHSNVGLLHATMAIFNAFVDRAPIFVMGATGPWDSTQRRPWIDWIHTSNGQGDVIRDYTKWETQPGSVAAIPESMLRAWQVIHTEPGGPAYVCFDAGLQEQRIPEDRPVPLPDVERYPLPHAIEPSDAEVRAAARMLVSAEFPVIMLGRAGQTDTAWQRLVDLAETLGAAVISDAKARASFPTNHWLHQSSPLQMGAEFQEVLRRADVVLALDKLDPAGTLRATFGGGDRGGRAGEVARAWPRLINVTLEPFAVRSWAADYQELPPADLPILANAERTVAALLEAVRREVRDHPGAQGRIDARSTELRERRARLEANWEEQRQVQWNERPIRTGRLLGELRQAYGSRFDDVILTHGPLTWAKGVWDFSRAGSYLGGDGGAGIGSGPGISVGAALAARGSGRPVLAVLGDGDTFMAPQALWTAAHHQIPLLVVVSNNQTYFNDEEHQERVARTRERPVQNRWVGQRMSDPAVDFATLARGMGVEGFGPIEDPDDLATTYARAIAAVDEGQPALVDVRVKTEK